MWDIRGWILWRAIDKPLDTADPLQYLEIALADRAKLIKQAHWKDPFPFSSSPSSTTLSGQHGLAEAALSSESLFSRTLLSLLA